MQDINRIGKKANLEPWTRLAGAALDARNDLRLAVCEVDRALSGSTVDPDLLTRLRAILVRHAEALKCALKRPGGRT